MIIPVLQMLRARRAQAITVFMLSVLASGAAVIGPAALAVTDRTVIRNEVAAARPSERTMTLSTVGSGLDTGSDFERLAPLVLDASGFSQVYTTQLSIVMVDRPVAAENLLALRFREDVCAHLTIVAGRCLMGTYEVVLGEQTAHRLGLGPGSTLHTDEVNLPEQGGVVTAAGNPRRMMVVGTYRITDPAALYWAQPAELGPDAPSAGEEPVFTTRLTAGHSSSRHQPQTIVAFMPPDLLTPDNLDEVQSGVEAVDRTVATGGGGTSVTFDSDIPELISRIKSNMEVVHALAPLAFVPLILLILYVTYVAMISSITGHRQELALAGIRGTPRGQRWWLAAGETLIAIVAGAPIGFLLGHAAVTAVARLTFGDAGGAGPTATTAAYAGLALVGAIGAGALALATEIRRPVSALLRRVPSRAYQVRTAVVELLVITLAGLAVVQLRSGGDFTGLASLVPGLVVVSLALVGARVVAPVAAAASTAGFRRRRLGWALAAIHVARRPGSQRLLVLVSVSIALLGFAVASLDVGRRARHERAVVETGSSTVVSLEPIEARTLLARVRTVDPTGAYAMAVASTPSVAPVLAVDATRLATAAAWRADYGITPEELGRLLHPPAPASVIVRATDITVDVDNDATVGADDRTLVMSFAPLAGGPMLDVFSRALQPGRHTYRLPIPTCADGCRVTGFRLVTAGDPTGPLTATLFGLRAGDSPLLTPADFADRTRWLGLNGTTVEAGPDGVVVTATPSARDSTRVVVLDAPYPLPIAATAAQAAVSARVTGLDRRNMDAVLVARPRMLPRLGIDAAMVDLEYLDRLTAGTSILSGAQVWLGPNAPRDAVARLRAAGLPVTTTLSAPQAERRYAGQGPSLVLWFYLVAAVFALLLALGGLGVVTSVDRRRLAQDLRYLRWQGLSDRDVRRASTWASLGLVLAGGLVGLANTWLTWFVVGDQMPHFVDAQIPFAAPRWPSPWAVAWPWILAMVVIVTVAAAFASQTRRLVVASPRSWR